MCVCVVSLTTIIIVSVLLDLAALDLTGTIVTELWEFSKLSKFLAFPFFSCC